LPVQLSAHGQVCEIRVGRFHGTVDDRRPTSTLERNVHGMAVINGERAGGTVAFALAAGRGTEQVRDQRHADRVQKALLFVLRPCAWTAQGVAEDGADDPLGVRPEHTLDAVARDDGYELPAGMAAQ